MLFSSAGCCIALGVITVLAFFALLIAGIIIALCWKRKGIPSKLVVQFRNLLYIVLLQNVFHLHRIHV